MPFHRNIHYNKSNVFREEQGSSASLCITATMCLIYRFALLRHSLGHLPYRCVYTCRFHQTNRQSLAKK